MSNYDKQLQRLLSAYPDSYITEQMNKLWLPKWSDYSMSVIHRSVDRAIREFHQFPKLDEFMEIVVDESTRQNRAALRDRMDNCSICDHGYIETKPDAFRPCENCIPDTYHRWAVGDYEPSQQ